MFFGHVNSETIIQLICILTNAKFVAENKIDTEVDPSQACNAENYESYPCPGGFTVLHDFSTCIYCSPVKKTKEEAWLTCRNKSSDLVHIYTAQFDSAINRYLPVSGASLIGIVNSGDQWVWMVDHKPLTYTNWATSAPEPDVSTCVFKDPQLSFGWTPGDCNAEHFFVCQMPHASSLNDVFIRYDDDGDGSILMNETFRTVCTIVGESQRYVRFRLFGTVFSGSNDVVIESSESNDTRIHIGNLTYSAYYDVCLKSRETTLDLLPIFSYNDQLVECCGRSMSGTDFCGAHHSPNILPIPLRPSLVWVYPKDGMIATCDAVTYYRGHITWVMTSPRHAWRWRTDHINKTTEGPTVGNVHLENPKTGTSDKGYTIQQRLLVRLSRRFERHTIACFTSEPRDVLTSADLKALQATDPLMSNVHTMLIFDPKPPELLEEQRKEGRAIWILATCSAYVGTAGVMTWRLEVNNSIAGEWFINEAGTITGRLPDTVAQRKFIVDYATTTGLHFESEMDVNLNLTLSVASPDGRLTCFSYNTSNVVVGNGTTSLRKSLGFALDGLATAEVEEKEGLDIHREGENFAAPRVGASVKDGDGEESDVMFELSLLLGLPVLTFFLVAHLTTMVIDFIEGRRALNADASVVDSVTATGRATDKDSTSVSGLDTDNDSKSVTGLDADKDSTSVTELDTDKDSTSVTELDTDKDSTSVTELDTVHDDQISGTTSTEVSSDWSV